MYMFKFHRDKKLAARTFNFATLNSTVCAWLIYDCTVAVNLYYRHWKLMDKINFAYFLNLSTLAKLMNPMCICVLLFLCIRLDVVSEWWERACSRQWAGHWCEAVRVLCRQYQSGFCAGKGCACECALLEWSLWCVQVARPCPDCHQSLLFFLFFFCFFFFRIASDKKLGTTWKWW